jgi:hypothetical protein
LIPETNFGLIRLSKEKTKFRKGFPLSFDVNYSLIKLLERELDLARAIEILLEDIKGRYDYNIIDVYSSLKGYGNFISMEGYIDIIILYIYSFYPYNEFNLILF